MLNGLPRKIVDNQGKAQYRETELENKISKHFLYLKSHYNKQLEHSKNGQSGGKSSG